MGIKTTFPTIIQTAFGIIPDRIIYRTELPQGEYDFIANLPHGSPKALQEEIKRKFGLIGKIETVQTNIFLLKVKSPSSAGLKLATATIGSNDTRNGEILATRQTLPELAMQLEVTYFKTPVIDQTDLKDAFDFKLEWDSNDGNLDNLKRALVEQLGLELVPSREPIEMLVVEKAKRW